VYCKACWLQYYQEEPISEDGLREEEYEIEDEEGQEDDGGDESEDTSDVNDGAGFQRPSLPVKGEPNFESGPPTDAAEYLRRVKFEARGLPNVVVTREKYTNKQASYLPAIEKSARSPPELLPSAEWEQQFGSDFSDIRQSLIRYTLVHFKARQQMQFDLKLPGLRDGSAWKRLLLGEIIDDDRNDQVDVGYKPQLSLVCRLDQVTTRMLINLLVHQCESSVSRQVALWLFALLLRLDKPIDADMSATLRHLYRQLSKIRATLPASAPHAPEVIHCNVILTAIDRCFGQRA